jgi:hypothetical protein
VVIEAYLGKRWLARCGALMLAITGLGVSYGASTLSTEVSLEVARASS